MNNTKKINLIKKQFVKGSRDAIWTAEVSITDPKYVDQAAGIITKNIYKDWEQQNLVKLSAGK